MENTNHESIEFLKEIMPPGGYINIREIYEGKGKNKFYTRENIDKYNPPKDRDVYFGVFSRRVRKGAAEFCHHTSAIWMDYDDGAQLQDVKRRLSEHNLPKPTFFISSGHGIHVYWLLDKPATAEEVMLCVKGIAQTTGADMRAAEVARIMRLPGTINHKERETVSCVLFENNQAKYRLDQFKPFEMICSISKPSISDLHAFDNCNRPCIAKLAKGVPIGHRNFAEGRLVKYLQQQGYTKKDTWSIISKWNQKNTPPESTSKLENDFNCYWHKDYTLLGCSIPNGSLQDILSVYCYKPECNLSGRIDKLELSQAVKYNNRLMSQIKDFSGNDLIVYGILCIDFQGLRTSELIKKLTARATKKCCMSDKTFSASTKRLKKAGLIEIIKSSRQSGYEYFYKAIPQGTYGLGYTLISTGAINGAIDGRVTPGEFKLYTLLLKYAYTKGNCYPSCETLAKELRVSKAYVTKVLNNLSEANYIRKRYVYPKGVKKLVMTLLV